MGKSRNEKKVSVLQSVLIHSFAYLLLIHVSDDIGYIIYR